MRKRQGYSLIELLVVISIIAVLVGLVTSGVQKVRAAAARTACGNRLRQLGLSLHKYHDTHRRLPPGVTSDADPKSFPYVGWTARLLPYVEEKALWTEVETAFASDPKPTEFYGHPPHADLLGRVVTHFVCPADSRAAKPHTFKRDIRVAFTTYLGVSGTSTFRRNGVLFADSAVRTADITDGLSNTIAVGERPPSADGQLGWWYRGWGQSQDGSAEMLLGVRERNSGGTHGGCPRGPYHFEAGRANDPCAAFHFWSLHPGGAHFAFADGSVRFLAYSADEVMPALATRGGSEVVVVPD